MKKTGTIARVLAILMAVCIAAACFTACGPEEIKIKVKDMGTETEVTVNTGVTVKEALTEAEIKLGAKDVTEPALDKTVTVETKVITVKRYAKVTVVNGEEKKVVELVGGTVEEAIQKAGFTLAEGYTPDAEMTDYLKDGITITIAKGYKVKLTADGSTKDVVSKAATVKDLLAEQNITLGADDEVSPKASTALKDGLKVVVKRVTYKEVTETESIDFETEEQYSDSMAEGTSEVKQEGVKGQKKVTYKVKYVDGEEVSREVVSETVTKEPVNKIVVYGSASSGDDGGSGSGERYIVSKQAVPDCDGSGHGYYIIVWSDGEPEYVPY